MAMGYNNKILMVNLTTGEIGVEEPGEKFYRQYLGGTGLGTYYCMRDIPKGADPLGPDNVLVISTGVGTGAPVMAASRVCANAKSPVTGGIGDAQGGGFFGPAMKFAGFDAVVFKGKSEKPVYLFLQDGKAELRDASGIWGLTTKDYETKLREEISKDVVVCGIGPAGEKLYRYACIINERKHANGRTGMGCVMGSKNVKCIAAIGKKAPFEYADRAKLTEHARWSSEYAKTSPMFEGMFNFGTNRGIVAQNSAGMLPTKNFSEGYFEPTEATLTSMVMNDTISIGNERCYMCNIACKRHVKCNKEEHGWDVDPDYGGPEYETVAMFGSDCGIGDLPTVSKANEICNAYGMDTISAGASVAFAMELYEKGILTKEQCYGHELNFGNKEGAICLLQKMAGREGWLGNALANGIAEAAKEIGNGAEYYNMSVKNNPHPAHMPQGKKNLALHYSVNTYGSDHMSVMHTPLFSQGAFQSDESSRGLYAMALYEPVAQDHIDPGNVKVTYYTQLWRAVIDSICVCMMGFGPTGNMYGVKDTVSIVNAATGWDTNFWEMMKAGERTRNLMAMFNHREGLTIEDDMLPERMFKQPFTEGTLEGVTVDKEDLLSARELYYDMVGWNTKTGEPKLSKIYEVDLGWALERM